MKHLKAVVRNEFYHVLRDPGTLLLVTLGPLLLLLVLAYTLTTDVKNVPIAVVDMADNTASQQLTERLDASEKLHVSRHVDSTAKLDDYFEKGDIRAAIIIPAAYGSALDASPQIIIDGTEPTSAESALDVMLATIDQQNTRLAQVDPTTAAFWNAPIHVTTERRFNHDLRAIVDYYPGLAAVVLSLPGIALALSLARENELGTMEQLVATPISKFGLLTGKIMPYLIFGMISTFVVLVVGNTTFNVPFRGNLLAYAVLAFLFMFSNMGLGLLISVLIRSQQVAMIVAVLVFFLPGFFLSGVFFPLAAMPGEVQLEAQMLPVTHFVAASKYLYLQGGSFSALVMPVVWLSVLSISITLTSIALFRKKVA